MLGSSWSPSCSRKASIVLLQTEFDVISIELYLFMGCHVGCQLGASVDFEVVQMLRCVAIMGHVTYL